MAVTTPLPARRWATSALALGCWITNALAPILTYALLLAVCLSLVIGFGFTVAIAFLPTLAFLFAVIVVASLAAFFLPVAILIIVAVKSTKRRTSKSREQDFVPMVPCFEGNEIDEKLADLISNADSSANLDFSANSSSIDLAIDEDRPDLFGGWKDLGDKTEQDSYCSSELSSIYGESFYSESESGSVLDEELDAETSMWGEHFESPLLKTFGEGWGSSIEEWLEREEEKDKMAKKKYTPAGLEVIGEEEED
jgi:hypothetical protein